MDSHFGLRRNDVVNSDDYRAYVGGTSGLIYSYVNDGFYTVADFGILRLKSRTWKLKRRCGRLKSIVRHRVR